jgi:hypothetical protein
VSDTTLSFLLAYVQHPEPEDAAVDQSLAPEGSPNTREVLDELLQVLMSDERQLAGRQRCKGVVHLLDVQALEIRYLARDVERENLSGAVRGHLVAVGKAFDDEARPGRAVTVPDDVLPPC